LYNLQYKFTFGLYQVYILDCTIHTVNLRDDPK